MFSPEADSGTDALLLLLIAGHQFWKTRGRIFQYQSNIRKSYNWTITGWVTKKRGGIFYKSEREKFKEEQTSDTLSIAAIYRKCKNKLGH